jgi:hypothetical protein
MIISSILVLLFFSTISIVLYFNRLSAVQQKEIREITELNRKARINTHFTGADKVAKYGNNNMATTEVLINQELVDV